MTRTTALPTVRPTDVSTGSAGPAGPVADRFVRPALAWYVVNDAGLVALATCSLSAAAYDAAAARVPMLPRRVVQRITVGLGVLHVLEATYAYRSARAAGLAGSARKWAVQTLVVGFPALGTLRTVIRKAR